jgi:hypothetical protein
MFIRGMLVGCVLSVVCGMAQSPASADSPAKPSLKVTTPKPGEVVIVPPGKFTVIKAAGTHNLNPNDPVYAFLKCQFGHMYLQQPEVDLSDNTWRHDNIYVGENIRLLRFIQVPQAGKNKIKAWLEEKPRALSADEIRSLGGVTVGEVDLDVK